MWPRSRARSASPSAERTTAHGGERRRRCRPGVEPVVKMNGRAMFTSRSTKRRGPATNPPSEPSVFESVPTRSTSTPVEVGARARARRGPRRARAANRAGAANSTMASSGATSPSIENTVSVTTMVRATPSARARSRSAAEVLGVGVAVDDGLGPGHAAAVDDRGVVELVGQDAHAGAAEHGDGPRGWRRSRWGTAGRPRCRASRPGRPRGRGAPAASPTTRRAAPGPGAPALDGRRSAAAFTAGCWVRPR